MRLWAVVIATAVLFGSGGPALGYDPADEFRRGTVVITPQIGGGINNNLVGYRRITIIPQVNGTVRLSRLPLDPVGEGFWRGALETGIEPWLQYYPRQKAGAEGLKLVLRYHFLRASPLLPYVEALAGVGTTSLDVREINSDHTFVLEAGVGLSYFVTRGLALTAGYRFQHLSNAGTSRPNRGLNFDTGVFGVSFFFH